MGTRVCKKGGGHHSAHIHWNQHVSGFYFLKCSDKTFIYISHQKTADDKIKKNRVKCALGKQFHINQKLKHYILYLEHEYAVDW